MYNPDGAQSRGEWIELQNQMAIDMDISGWSLTGGAFFEFPAGTVIPGNSYLVIASNPAALEEDTGFVGAMGPFEGRLSNGGEDIMLRNNSDRMLDIVDYGDEGEWPVGPDGSGATLAKRGLHLASIRPSNWTTSWQVGGTPGAENFPAVDLTPVPTTLVSWNSEAKFEDSGNDLGTDWRDTSFDDSTWSVGQGILEAGDAQFPPANLGGLAEPGEGLFSYWPLDEGDGDVTANSGAGWDRGNAHQRTALGVRSATRVCRQF